MRAVKDRATTLRAALAEFEEQIVATERALADAKAQRDRNMEANTIEALVVAIERAVPRFDAGAAALVAAATTGAVSMVEATGFSTSVEAVRREILAAVELICWELRSAAVHTRAGNANVALSAPAAPEQPTPAISGN